MKTKLDYYRIFYETARFSSFSTAAQDLNTQLFNRSRRGVTLTKEGTLLFQKIENAMLSIEQGETMLARMQHLESGELTIAASDTITTHYLLPFLEQFHATYPGIRIEMANSYSSHMLQMVKEGKADLAFVNLPVTDDELCIKPCLEIHDIFVCGPEHNIKSSYSWEEIARQPLILLEKKSSSRRFLDKSFEAKNITLSPQIEIAAYDLLIRFASIHLGVSCVVEEFSGESLQSGVVIPMPVYPKLPARSIGFAYSKESSLSLASQAFLNLIQQNKRNIF